MSTVNQPPRLQLGDAPLDAYQSSPSDQFALLWQTTGDLAGDEFLVEYRSLGSTSWIAAPSPTIIDTGVDSRVNHTVTVTGLEYDTFYEYRVRHFQGANLVQTYQSDFTTRLAPGDDQGFTFAAYGDSAEPTAIQPFRQVHSRINQVDPDFGLLLGDNAYRDGSHTDYDYRFVPTLAPEAVEWTKSHIDYSAFGNHDDNTEGGRPYLESYAFPIPIAGIDSPSSPLGSTPELNYSFDYGNTHFVTFDSNILDDSAALDQLLNYVEADLAASTAKWNIVFAHHPVAGSPDKSEDPSNNYYRQVVPRLNSADVDLFLVGHSHTFSWTYPLTGYLGSNATFVQDDDKVYDKGVGLVQAVIGTGGTALRDGSFDYPFVASGYSQSTAIPAEHGFAHISVTDESITVDYVAADDGAIIDSFQIVDSGSPPPDTSQYSFQNGVAGYTGTVDTYLQQAAPSNNNGTATELNVDNDDDGGPVQVLLRFDNLFGAQPNQIAVDANIQSAVLELDVTNPGSSFQVYQMLQGWSDSATWDSLSNGVQTNNLEAKNVAVASTGAVSTGALSLDLTASVLDWQSNTTENHGWVMVSTGGNGVDFYSAEGLSAPRLVVDVNPQAGGNNLAPIAIADSYTVAENLPLTVDSLNGVLANDSDPDGDSLSVNPVPVMAPSNGSLTLNSDGSFSYAPDAGFSGADSFVYEISDGNGGTAQATATINVTDVNVAPTAVDDSYVTSEDTPLTTAVGVDDLLLNDSDQNGDSLSVNPVPVTAPSNGSLTLSSDGSFTYTPDAGFSGADSFVYEISDGNGGTAQALVLLTIDPIPEEITELSFQSGVAGYAGTVDTYIQQAAPNNSNSTAVELNIDNDDDGGPVQGLLRFDNLFGAQPNQISVDANIQSAVLELDVTNRGSNFQLHQMLQEWSDTTTWNGLGNGIQTDNIEAKNVAVASTGGAVSIGVLTLDVTASVLDWQNDPTTNYGWAMISTGGNGVDFYSAEGFNSPRLVVELNNQTNGNNLAPMTTADSYTVTEDSFLVVDEANGILANDSDLDGDNLFAIAVNTPTNGSLTLNSNGSFQYVPDTGFFGTDSFSYQATDGSLTSSETEVTITVDPSPFNRFEFQQGNAGYTGTVDTYLQQASPDNTNSSAPELNVDHEDFGGPVQGLLRFDDLFGTQPGQIALDANIQAAFLELEVINPGDAFLLHNMLQDWNQDATWNSFGNGVQANGIEADGVAVASTGPLGIGVLTLDVTSSVLGWQANPNSNYGWALLTTSGFDGVDFYSSEGIQAPRLVVDVG